jgi:lipopolysaccharide/colanic/teichoic acid biosynthesis glycosyltransferase
MKGLTLLVAMFAVPWVLLRTTGHRLGERFADWVLPDERPASYRLALLILWVARHLAPKESLAATYLLEARAEVEEANRSGQLLGLLRLVVPLIPQAPRARGLSKRAVDVFVAATTIAFVAPVLAVIALVVRVSSPGPVIYREIRIGQGQREFWVLKFRTRRSETESSGHRIDGAVRRWDSVTPIGRYLVWSSLDELPNLFNVLRGDMSLVGPRPYRPLELKTLEPHHLDRFAVRPGVTGVEQVDEQVRAFVEVRDKDVEYARAHSFRGDMRLLLRTFKVAFHRRKV